MAVDVSIKVEDAALRAALERTRLGLPLGGQMQPLMEELGRVLKTGAQLRFRAQRGPDGEAWKQSWRAAQSGGQTLSLSRRLRNSLSYEATPSSVAVGTNVIYAAIHQFGGVIRAKSGPFLAIPVTPMARKAGSPRNMPNLSVWQTLKGQYVMGDRDRGTVHFLLRRQVTMPARPFLGASDGDRAELLRVMQGHLQRAWGRG